MRLLACPVQADDLHRGSYRPNQMNATRKPDGQFAPEADFIFFSGSRFSREEPPRKRRLVLENRNIHKGYGFIYVTYLRTIKCGTPLAILRISAVCRILKNRGSGLSRGVFCGTPFRIDEKQRRSRFETDLVLDFEPDAELRRDLDF